ncbi:MAG TPA: hypothetical protein VLQ90_14435, partial [Pyrinomonadaceae bacterium]|nr:hypothetical protein [Pyrinomonadaceae bacterium]
IIVSDGQVLVDGVIVSDGVIISDGIIVSDSVVVAQAAQSEGDPVDGCPAVEDFEVDFIDY